jgi:hypothetical protein
MLKRMLPWISHGSILSLSKNYPNASVSCIIEETGVFLWNSGEKMHGKSQLSSISIRWCLQIIF